jgi:hypothetical protein
MAQSMQPENDYEDFLRNEKIKYLDFNGKKVLDVGGGSGEVWKNQNIVSSTRIDLFEPDGDLAGRAFDSGIYHTVSTKYPSSLLLPVEEYDVVCILGVLEHVDDPVKFMLQFDGAKRFYITVPNANSFHRHMGLHMGLIQSIDELGPQDLEIGHKVVFDRNTLWAKMFEFRRESSFEYIIENEKTTSFKVGTSKDMLELGEEKIEAMNRVAEKLDISGYGLFGAEIVMEVVRHENRFSSWV